MTTVTRYMYDINFVYTGITEVDIEDAMPNNSTGYAPPALETGQYAVWKNYSSWIIVNTYPWPQPDPITTTQVDAERDRRIASGFMFNGKLIQSKMTDRENVSGAAQLAFMAIVGGALPGDLRWSDPDNDFAWIAADNTLFTLDAPGTVNMGKTAAAAKQNLIFKARELKNLNPIPIDYTDAKWW